jgi:hypothetical protein
MPIPWLQIVDAALGLANFARGRPARLEPADPGQQIAQSAGVVGHLEARLAGVVVAALKEAFDRDTRRLELEREQMEAERRRAERALRLEMLRQAGDREIGRLRLVAGVAVATWIGTLFFSTRLIGGPVAARIAVGAGWALLLAALALAFSAQSRVSDALRAAADTDAMPRDQFDGGVAGRLAPWLIVVGLAVLGLAVLMST